MAKVELTRHYSTARGDLFAYITEPDEWARWYNNCIAVRRSDAWTTPGDEADLTFRLVGRDIDVSMELREYVPGEHTRVRVRAEGLPDVVQTWDLENADGGTSMSVVLETEESTSFFGKVIDRFLMPKTIERDLARSLDNLHDQVAIGL